MLPTHQPTQRPSARPDPDPEEFPKESCLGASPTPRGHRSRSTAKLLHTKLPRADFHPPFPAAAWEDTTPGQLPLGPGPACRATQLEESPGHGGSSSSMEAPPREGAQWLDLGLCCSADPGERGFSLFLSLSGGMGQHLSLPSEACRTTCCVS